MKISPRVIGVLLLGSGLCALHYQVVWVRSLRLVFGAALPAAATVLGIFMAGLGLGSYLLSKRAERSKNPLLLYANLEIGIAALTALSPFLIDGVRAAYLATGGTGTLGGVGATALRVIMCALVLGGPVVMMGGTLPAAARAVTSARDTARSGLALIYGLNTIGGVAGTVLSNFVFLELYGQRRSLWVVCCINLLIAMVARRLARSYAEQEHDENEPDAPAESSTVAPSPPWAIYLASFGTGAAFLLLELVWTRMAAPLIGGSTYSFGLVLAVALSGIGLGSFACAFVPARFKRPEVFALSCALQAFFVILPFAWGDGFALAVHDVSKGLTGSFFGRLLSWSFCASALVFVPAFLSGFQFPLLMSLVGRGQKNIAVDVGRVYAANTVGTILGSVLGGFVIIPVLGALGAWTATVFLLIVIGAPFLRQRPRAALVWGPLAVLTCALVFADGPQAVWRHSGIGAERANFSQQTFQREAQRRTMNRHLIYEHDGKEATVGVSVDNGINHITNGKSDGNTLFDRSTTYTVALLPSLLHKNPKRALIIGLGTGQTTGVISQVETMEQVDAYEIEEGVLHIAELAKGSNFDVLNTKNVNITVADGREAILTSDGKYDLVSSEPSNPYRAGIAAFFTREYYRAVKARLNEGGIFAHWIQGYEIDAETFVLVLATLRSEFEFISVWGVHSDFILLASQSPVIVDVETARERVKAPVYQKYLGRVLKSHDLEGILALHVAQPGFVDLATEVTDNRNVDDHMAIEFRFARSVGTQSRASPRQVLSLARSANIHLPQVDGVIDTELLERLRARTSKTDAAVAKSADEPHPADVAARLFRLEVEAQRGELTREDRADDLAELTSRAPADVAWIRAHQRERPSVELLLAALKASQDDAYQDPARTGRGIAYLTSLSSLSKEEYASIARELLTPLSEFIANDQRQEAAFVLAMRAEDSELCRAALDAVEPNVWWKAEILQLRLACYEGANDPRAEAAREDLDRFVAQRGRTLSELMSR